jgi:phosphoglycolate phosphatase
MRTVIFDLDGTLADTSRDMIAAANAAFRVLGHGAPLDPEADRETGMQGGRAMLRLGRARLGLPEDEAAVSAQYPVLLDAYAADIARHSCLFPGVPAALDALAGAGYRLGICTNKPAHLAEVLLVRLGVRERFGAMIGAGSLAVNKPDPAPYRAAVEAAGGRLARSLLIGDTETDRRTARAAGVPCVLVTFGAGGRDVAALDPEAVMEHFDQLAGTVARLIG